MLMVYRDIILIKLDKLRFRLVKGDGTRLSTDKDVDNEFNSYFPNVASVLDNNIPGTVFDAYMVLMYL